MRRRRPILGVPHAGSAALVLAVLAGATARADPRDLASLQGAWVADGSRCEDTFFRQGKAIHFVRRGAVKREGILIKSDRVEDSRNRCKIESGKPEPGERAVRLTCFSGLQVSKTALSVQLADQDTLVRTSGGFAGDVRRFRRCRI